MSIAQTIKNLWREAPAWRYTTVAASVLTAVLVVGALTGVGGPSSRSASQQAGPGGNTPPVQTPPQPPVAQVPAAVEARWQQFLNKVNAANQEQRLGERCSRMVDSLEILETGDWAWAKGDQDRSDALKTAQDCTDNVADSDVRLATLETAHANAEKDQSVQHVQALATARRGLNDTFDLSRELPSTLNRAVIAGDAAIDQLSASDARIDQLVAAAAAVEAAADPAPAQLNALADAGTAITSFDSSRLTEAQGAALAAASGAAAKLEASRARIGRLVSALARAQVSTDPPRQELIDAVAAITPFDVAQADPTQRAKIEQARGRAAELAMAQLSTVSAAFDPDREDPALYSRLRNLKRLIEANGGLVEPSPDQSQALRHAEMATARLDESARRLTRLRAAATSWTRNPSPEQAGLVKAAYDAVSNPFDRARFETADEEAYATLNSALTVLSARDTGLTPANRTRVPIYVADTSGSEHAQDAVDLLRSRLISANYHLVARAEEAAVRLALSGLNVAPSRLQVGSRAYVGALVGADLLASWSFTDEVFLRARGEGRDTGHTLASTTREAVADAVADAFSNFHAQVLAAQE